MEREGFSKKFRLRRPSQFREVFVKGKRIKGKALTLIYFTRKKERGEAAGPAGYPRIGIVVPAAKLGAVERNRIKRVAREFFRIIKRNLDGGTDIVVISAKESEESDPRKIRGELQFLFGKANLWRRKDH